MELDAYAGVKGTIGKVLLRFGRDLLRLSQSSLGLIVARSSTYVELKAGLAAPKYGRAVRSAVRCSTRRTTRSRPAASGRSKAPSRRSCRRSSAGSRRPSAHLIGYQKGEDAEYKLQRRQRQRQLRLLERRHQFRPGQELVAGCSLLGYEHLRLRQLLLAGPTLPVRRAGRRYPQVHVLIVHELSEMRRAPFGARLLLGCGEFNLPIKLIWCCARRSSC